MTGELGYSLPPAIRRIATNFRISGWVSFWVQVVIGVISLLLFLINVLDQNLSAGNKTSSIVGASLFVAIGILAVFVGAFWAFNYVRLGRKLKTSNPDTRPKPKDAIRSVRIGLIISLVGMGVTLVGAQSVVALLWLRSLRQVSFGIGTADPDAFIRADDIAIVFSFINTLFAHFIGLGVSLWLQYVVDRQ